MGYWLNFDSARVTLHTVDCSFAKYWAQEPKWKKFDAEEDAHRATCRDVHECAHCLE